MIRVSLPSGATADLRPSADVTERQRRPIKRIQAQLGAKPAFVAAIGEAKDVEGELSAEAQLKIAAGMGDAFELLEQLNDFLVAAVVAGWSYDFPVSADAVQDLSGRDLDALREKVAPYMAELSPGFEPTPEDESPTEPSTA